MEGIELLEERVDRLNETTAGILKYANSLDDLIKNQNERIFDLTVAINYLINENLGNDEKAKKIKELLHL